MNEIIINAEKIRVEPGDTVVLKMPGHLSPENVNNIKNQAKAMFPDNRILVLSDGMTIEKARGGE